VSQQQGHQLTTDSLFPKTNTAESQQLRHKLTADNLFPRTSTAGSQHQLHHHLTADSLFPKVSTVGFQLRHQLAAESLFPRTSTAGSQQQRHQYTADSLFPRTSTAGSQLRHQLTADDLFPKPSTAVTYNHNSFTADPTFEAHRSAAGNVVKNFTGNQHYNSRDRARQTVADIEQYLTMGDSVPPSSSTNQHNLLGLESAHQSSAAMKSNESATTVLSRQQHHVFPQLCDPSTSNLSTQVKCHFPLTRSLENNPATSMHCSTSTADHMLTSSSTVDTLKHPIWSSWSLYTNIPALGPQSKQQQIQVERSSLPSHCMEINPLTSQPVALAEHQTVHEQVTNLFVTLYHFQ